MSAASVNSSALVHTNAAVHPMHKAPTTKPLTSHEPRHSTSRHHSAQRHGHFKPTRSHSPQHRLRHSSSADAQAALHALKLLDDSQWDSLHIHHDYVNQHGRVFDVDKVHNTDWEKGNSMLLQGDPRMREDFMIALMNSGANLDGNLWTGKDQVTRDSFGLVRNTHHFYVPKEPHRLITDWTQHASSPPVCFLLSAFASSHKLITVVLSSGDTEMLGHVAGAAMRAALASNSSNVHSQLTNAGALAGIQQFELAVSLRRDKLSSSSQVISRTDCTIAISERTLLTDWLLALRVVLLAGSFLQFRS